MVILKIFVCQEAEWDSIFNKIKINHVQKSFYVHACTQKPSFAKFNLNSTACWQPWTIVFLCKSVTKCNKQVHAHAHAHALANHIKKCMHSHSQAHALETTHAQTSVHIPQKPLWVEVKPVPTCDAVCAHQILGSRLCACPQSKVPDALLYMSTLSWVLYAS